MNFPQDRSTEHFRITDKPWAGDEMAVHGEGLCYRKLCHGLFTDTRFPNVVFIYFPTMTNTVFIKFLG